MHRGWNEVLIVGASALTLVLSACGGGSAEQPPAAPATALPAAPTATRPSAASPGPSPAARPSPSPAATSASAQVVYVANTDGEGVYVRQTPAMADKVRAYPDGTALTVIGDDVDGDGRHWKHVRAPDGLDGYVPSTYTDATPP